jgi:hypothetical protein
MKQHANNSAEFANFMSLRVPGRKCIALDYRTLNTNIANKDI